MVGADIGCGVCSVETNIYTADLPTDTLKKIMSRIREEIPMGMKWRETRLLETLSWLKKGPYCETLYDQAMLQLGTLGGGNHFIEIQKDETGKVWFMIHCGSRNLGKKVGDYYNEIAKEQCLAREEENIVKQDLTYLVQGTKAFSDYVRDEWTCVKFAELNRKMIANKICDIFKEFFPLFEEKSRLDCRHNYAEEQNGLFLHRKGAVSIQHGKALIAGSQGTSSFMVEALPTAEKTYWTCSHGAGRKMGRMAAVRDLDLQAEIKLLEDQGIIGSIRTQKDLEEATGCYKDIYEVMEQQKEFVKVIHEFKPMGVMKGN